jgi:hypothetical protein
MISSQPSLPRHARRDARPQLVAVLTSLPIIFSTAGVNLFRAKEVGQMSPSSRFAACWKPKVAYLALNFCPLWKKQTTLPSLAYAGIPYQVLGARVGALALAIVKLICITLIGRCRHRSVRNPRLSWPGVFARGPRATISKSLVTAVARSYWAGGFPPSPESSAPEVQLRGSKGRYGTGSDVSCYACPPCPTPATASARLMSPRGPSV